MVICATVMACTNATQRNTEEGSQNTDRQSESPELIRISENEVSGIDLPLPKKEMLPELMESFKGFTVHKALGQFEYGAALVYEMKYEDQNIALFEMDMQDTLKLNNLYLRKYVIDEYGVMVGEPFQKLKALRGENIKHYTDFHQHTYVIVPNSNIMYKIFGDFPDNIDLSDISLTENDIADWKVEECSRLLCLEC